MLVVGDSLGRNFFEALVCQLSAVGPLVPLGDASDRGVSESQTDEGERSEAENGEEGMSDWGMSGRGISDQGISDRGTSGREEGNREMPGRRLSGRAANDGEETDREKGDGGLDNRERTDRGATELFWSEQFNVTVGRVTSEFLVMRDTSGEELGKYGQVSSQKISGLGELCDGQKHLSLQEKRLSPELQLQTDRPYLL